MPMGSTNDNILDGAERDGFGRLRTAEPQTVFDTSFYYDKQPLLFSESTSLGGTVTHLTNSKAVSLAVTTTTNSSAVFQSRRHINYQPGKCTSVNISGNLKGAASGVIKRIGQFDSANGVFFELDSSTLYVVIRSSITGSVVDTRVAQSSWNIDTMNGTGPSGITLDLTKQQIFFIDYQWLGSGRVRFGFYLDGQLYYCHEFLHSNYLSELWCQTANNPVAATILNTASTAATLEITCCSVISEAGWFPDGIVRTINNGITARTFGLLGSTNVPVLSLRKKTAYIKATVQVVDIGAFAQSGDDFLVTLVLNGTLTGASWGDVSGACQRDVSATSVSGGEELLSFYIRGSSGVSALTFKSLFTDTVNVYLGSTVSGVSDIITISVVNLTSSASFLGYLNYKEVV